MSEASKYMKLAEQNVLHTYNRFPVVFERGEGVWLTDVEGKRYLDSAPVLPYLPWAMAIKHITMR